MWAVGCMFAELLSCKVLFSGQEVPQEPGKPAPLQEDQLRRIFAVFGTPKVADWPTLEYMPHWKETVSKWRLLPSVPNSLKSIVKLGHGDPQEFAAFDLLQSMLTYDPNKRITTKQALEHPFFTQATIPHRK